ncbi:hypothetical protein QBC35DRAFT_490087 [Podospora australis]|uniref:Secreted protein n=1 Tax=Podospora australis TaxID=1536484 RepID=A0AAN6WYL2_9PEZI|nr:hypothetical protein QBC35DRAFT_490087 [Podospora australis]
MLSSFPSSLLTLASTALFPTPLQVVEAIQPGRISPSLNPNTYRFLPPRFCAVGIFCVTYSRKLHLIRCRVPKRVCRRRPLFSCLCLRETNSTHRHWPKGSP